MTTREEKARRFAALHERGEAFVMPNPWDAGTARLLARLGFEALATTSAGFAFSTGRRDYGITLADAIRHVETLAPATDLPLSADLENGFGDAPEEAARAIRLAAEAGAVGGSIEDATGRSDHPLYERPHAVERIQAAAESAHSLPFPFTLTARCEGRLVGRPDLDEIVTRLQAYQEAGADVLYAPGIKTREDISTVVRAVDRPVNVLMGAPGETLTVTDLSGLGVKRISVGSALARVALGAMLEAAREIADGGTFGACGRAAAYRDINDMLDRST